MCWQCPDMWTSSPKRSKPCYQNRKVLVEANARWYIHSYAYQRLLRDWDSNGASYSLISIGGCGPECQKVKIQLMTSNRLTNQIWAHKSDGIHTWSWLRGAITKAHRNRWDGTGYMDWKVNSWNPPNKILINVNDISEPINRNTYNQYSPIIMAQRIRWHMPVDVDKRASQAKKVGILLMKWDGPVLRRR
jgi:hypothetical protein